MNTRWTKNNISRCIKCKVKFTMMLRKYNCIKCGLIFCYTCLVECRICNNCNITIPLLNSNISIIDIISFLNINLEIYNILKFINKYFYNLYKIYLNKLKKIYRRLPVYDYDMKDLYYINTNITLLSNNPRWLAHIVTTQLKEINTRVNKIPDNLTTEDLFNILYLTCDENIVNLITKKLYQINIDEVYKYSYYIINLLIKFSEYNSYNSFFDYTINKVHIHDYYLNIYFWQINYYINNTNIGIFSDKLKKLINILTIEKYNLFMKTYDFCKNLSLLNINDSNYTSIIKHLNKNTYFDSDFMLPIYKLHIIIDFKSNDIDIIASKNKPIKFMFINDKQLPINILLKKGNLQKEYVIITLIKLFNNFITNETDINLNIIIYDIVPIFNNSGFIEIIPDCENLYNIKEHHKMSIQNYIFEKNTNLTIEDFKSNFIKSCAANIVIAYILGIGDRHLENILITNDGIIFNIDFEYILGIEPNYFIKVNNNKNIKITYDILDAIGGVNSKYFETFTNYCIEIYKCLRTHNIIIYNTLLTLDTIESCDLRKYLNNVFLLELSSEEACIEFKTIIINSCNNINYNLIDYIHKVSKDFIS